MDALPAPGQIEVALLPGARALLDAHAEELPQRDDLCGAFCGALALRAGGVLEQQGEPLDQDAVAAVAGSVVSRVADPRCLPAGEHGRRDYRISPPLIDDAAVSGTTAAGLAHAIEELSGGSLAALPFSGPWSARALEGVFELALSCEPSAAIVANLATRQLWGSRAPLPELLAYLYSGQQQGPPPDWDVGHFSCIFGRARGPSGTLYALADTYPSLGSGGVHVQPAERLALALERPLMPPGGAIVVVADAEAARVREGAATLGLREQAWDNGTLAREMLA
ncbi:MAG: hypothetical protein E6G34_12885 [Actinobacteria bacterium]|nr:MAG: hypothetical protein E6G34_12885 [Actinomycetota bacterium]